jgi:hypothetical protein
MTVDVYLKWNLQWTEALTYSTKNWSQKQGEIKHKILFNEHGLEWKQRELYETMCPACEN